MKKRWMTVLTTILLCMCLSTPVLAQDNLTRLVDDADYLSDGEEKELAEMLDEISSRQGMDIVIVTVPTLNGKDITAAADDYYDANGYRLDGILLMIDAGGRELAISTIGYGITVFTDKGQEYMTDRLASGLSDGDYTGALKTFAEDCDEFIRQAKAGKPYDIGNMPKKPFQVGRRLAFSLGIGFILALIYTEILRGQLKTVRRQPHASEYLKKDSLNITTRREMFLFKRLDKHKKETNQGSGSGGSRTHVSSSGRTHGGSRRSF